MDYKSFEKQGRKAGESDPLSGYWWKAQPTVAGQLMVDAAKFLCREQMYREQSHLRHARLYGNFDAMGFGLREHTRAASPGQLSLNVSASCADTLTAKIAKNQPRPSFITSGTSYAKQKAAKKLDKFMRGVFQETKVHREAVEVFLDACIFGTGALKGYLAEDTGRLKFERRFPGNLFVDDADGLNGRPTQLFERAWVDREKLLEEYGEDEEKRLAIEAATAGEAGDRMRGLGDSVEVWEGWHRKSGSKAKDGRHVIAIDGCALVDEPWTGDSFPFVFLHYTKRRLGFWGQGLVERLVGIQVEINRLLQSISEQLRRRGRGRIFVELGTKVNPASITNGIADIVHYTGHPPVVDSSNAVAAEEFMQLDRLYQRAFQEIGVSELSASAKKPSGLDAAVALREYSDIESERFAIISRAYENFFVDVAELAISLVGAKSRGYQVTVPHKRAVEQVDWRDIQLDREEYCIQVFPVSSLPQHPAARLQRVKELREEGLIPDMAEYRRLLDFPDLESHDNYANAALDDADETIGKILDADDPELPMVEAFQNLPLMRERATAAYLRYRHTDIGEERLDMLRQLIDACATAEIEIQEASAPPPAAPMAMDPMAPGAAAPAVPPMGGNDVNINQQFGASAPVAPAVPPIVG
jgi:hypothetical protein